MKRKSIILQIALILAVTLLVGCGNTTETTVEKRTESMLEAVAEASIETQPEQTYSEEVITEASQERTDIEEATTEASHEHAYTEVITTEATCESDGVKSFTCECGDTYTEVITAKGHSFENYVSNNDATYTADGTETSKCSRTAEGSMLTYTYTDMDAVMYAKQTINVRSIPNADGERLGDLNTNDEVKVTGQCVETSWYRIDYSGGVAYVSNSCLGTDKAEVETVTPTSITEQNVSLNSYAEARAYAISLGYPIGQAVDNGDGTVYCYVIGHPASPIYGEDDILHRADINSTRDHAKQILGASPTGSWNENGGTHVMKLGNGWTVYRFTTYHAVPKQSTSTLTTFPYELYTVYNDTGYSYFYCLENDLITKPDIWYSKHQECEIANGHQYLTYDNWTVTQSGGWRTNHKDSGYMFNGEKVMLATNFSSQEQLMNRGLW